MSCRGSFLLCLAVLLMRSASAVDVPFVFDSGSSEVAGYSSTQLEGIGATSPELSGVPPVSVPADSEILAFPVTGGGSTTGGSTEKKVGDLKKALNSRVEPDNSVVHHEAVALAARYPGDHTIDQISSIYIYLKNGDGSKKGWSYVPDPRGLDYFMYANETLTIGKDAGCAGAGDCDDFAILMSALVESIGGTTRIILARNNSTGGHAYAEVYLGRLDSENNQVEDVTRWLEQKFDTDKIFTHVDTDTREVWLNLDWGTDKKGNAHPGGPFYQGDEHIVLCIRDRYGKTSLNAPENAVNGQENTASLASTSDQKASEKMTAPSSQISQSSQISSALPISPSPVSASPGEAIPPGAGPVDWYANK